MKIGAVEIYWHPGKNTVRDLTIWHLRTDPEVKKILAMLGRSEIKNYLAEIAEIAELPYFGPVEFLRSVKQGANDTGDEMTGRHPDNCRCQFCREDQREAWAQDDNEDDFGKDSDESPDSL